MGVVWRAILESINKTRQEGKHENTRTAKGIGGMKVTVLAPILIHSASGGNGRQRTIQR